MEDSSHAVQVMCSMGFFVFCVTYQCDVKKYVDFMEEKMKITLKDGSVKEYSEGKTLYY